MIPALSTGGLLPPGRHSATLVEIEDFFVKRAPHADQRRRIFRAFELYMDLITELLPDGVVWVDGGFCTYKEAPPHDLDLAVLIDPRHQLSSEGWERMNQLFTLQGVAAQRPLTATGRLQPMGGLIDSFPVNALVPEQRELWDRTWSMVKGPDGKIIDGATKGYLEVSW